MALSVCVQIVHDCSSFHSGTEFPKPPMAFPARFDRFGLQRLSRSGLGLPNRFFIPCVKKNAAATARQRPIRAVLSSHSFRLQRSDFGTPLEALGPGTKMRQIRTMRMAGIIKETTTRTPVEIFSFATYGNEISGLTTENGRRFPVAL